MPQNAGNNQGGVNKTRDKSADRHRRSEQESGARNTEAKPLDPGVGTPSHGGGIGNPNTGTGRKTDKQSNKN